MVAIVVAIATGLTIDAAGLGSEHWRHHFVDRQLGLATDIAMFLFGLLFLVWFHRARINAEQSGWRQRRARAWTFWGWIIPIANLFVPFQLMGDIWRAALPAEERSKRGGIHVLWWVTWLLSDLYVGSRPRHDSGWPLVLLSSWPRQVLLIVSGLTLAAIIRIVSTSPVGYPPPFTPDPMPGLPTASAF
jgi:hypothetical protein